MSGLALIIGLIGIVGLGLLLSLGLANAAAEGDRILERAVQDHRKTHPRR